MSLDTLIAVLGLALAVYALLPAHRRLDLAIRLQLTERVAICIAALLFHYLQFYDTFSILGLTPHTGLAQLAITPQAASYGVLVATGVFIWRRVSQARLSRHQLRRLSDLIEVLIAQQQHADVIPLLRRYLPQLTGPLADHPISGDLLRATLTNKPFVEAVSQLHPLFGLTVLSCRTRHRSDFCDIYFTSLLTHRSSLLYTEVRNNQNIRSGNRYDLPESNRILSYLFADAEVARTLEVWRAFGETIIRDIERYGREAKPDPNLLPLGRYQVDEYYDSQWQSSVYVGLRVFDIMLYESLHQGVRDHMWLYYMPHIVRAILSNYNECASGVDRTAEYPTRYSYLLHTIVRMHLDWIREASFLPRDNPHAVLPDPRPMTDNGNIPKSAILSLIWCLEPIASCSELSDHFLTSLLQSVLERFYELAEGHTTQDFATCFINTIGQQTARDHYPSDLCTAMLTAIQGLDPVRFSPDASFRAQLESVLRT